MVWTKKEVDPEVCDPVLNAEEVAQFWRDGYLFIDRRLFNSVDVERAESLIDPLVARWDALPRWLAGQVRPGVAPVREIMYVLALAPPLRETGIYKLCGKMACVLLETNRTWCHFDHAIYKSAGSDAVLWHQDMAASRTRLLGRSVHFWIPLQDTSIRDGGMMFVPGSNRGKLLRHERQTVVEGPQIRVAPEAFPSCFESRVLPIGGLSVHTPLTLHASAPNQGDSVRKAWILQFGSRLPSAALEVAIRTSSHYFARGR